MEYNYESLYVNKNTGFMFRYVCCETESFVEHWHDYFEIFLILEGSITHIINGKSRHVEENSLVFIRPGDIHNIVCLEEKVRILNLSISKKTMSKLIEYLGSAFDKDKMILSALGPTVKVSDRFKEKMLNNFQKVNILETTDVKSYKLFMRSYLNEIISSCFLSTDTPIVCEENIPEWLLSLCKQMYIKKNFVAGHKRMVELSGKSQEHLGRMMKKYMNTTIVEFITGIRLEYASNILKNSNMTVTQICTDCGFENLSYFTIQFKKKYDISPTAFRKKAWQTD